ncbi:MAG TPA: SGNH/GDSL hydrolase family protein [Planctomycetota bacterium]|nr:SGNH/GDSL hydrolase family protein [Planctomycetota bacterium]
MADPRRNRRLAILAVCLLVLGLTIAWQAHRHVPRTHPLGSGPAGPAVAREPWTRTWTSSPVVLIGLGDSVTAGYGAPPPHSYFNRIATNPQDELLEMKGICLRSVFPNFKASNLSISGTISSEHAEEQFPKIERGGPETVGLIVMTSGGNDLIHDYGHNPPREGAMYGARLEQAGPWIESFEKRLHALFEKIKELFPGGCHIFIADIFDPTDGEGDIENAGLPKWPEGEAVLKAYNDVIHRSARKYPYVHVVPMHDAFLGHGIHCTDRGGKHYRPEDPTYWYYENLEDPNDRGYDAIRRLFLLEIEKVFSRRP